MKLVYVISVLIINILTVTEAEDIPCPKKCKCIEEGSTSCELFFTDLPVKLPLNTKKLKLTESIFHHIPADAFSSLTNLKILQLDNCMLERIDTHAFRSLNNLQVLDLSNNHLKDLPESLCDNAPELREISLDGNQFSTLPSSTMHKCKNIKVFKFSNNLPLCKDSINPIYKLTPQGNNVSIPQWFYQLGRFDYNDNCARKEMVRILYKLISHSWIIEELNLRGNNITELKNSAFIKAPQLRKLDLSNNAMRKIAGFAFYKLDKLDELNLSDNNLDGTLEQDTNGTILYFIESVSSLNLDNNGINLSGGLLENLHNLKNLKKLSLAKNRIAKWRKYIIEIIVPKITFLDLSSNQLLTIDEHMFGITGNLQEINLKNNPLKCTCDLEWFIEWVKSTNITITDYESYYCDIDGDRGLIKSLDLYTNCKAPMLGVVIGWSALGAVLLFVCCVPLLYRCQWRIRFWYHHKLASRNAYLCRTETFLHHAYISYAPDENDRKFVQEIFINKLDKRENEIEGKYSFFYQKRDSEPGEHVLNTMDRGISSCPCAVIIFSKNYLESRRHEMELIQLVDEGFLRNFPLIFATYGQDINIAAQAKMSKWVRILYNKSLTIHWESGDELRQIFYSKLTNVLDTMPVTNEAEIDSPV